MRIAKLRRQTPVGRRGAPSEMSGGEAICRLNAETSRLLREVWFQIAWSSAGRLGGSMRYILAVVTALTIVSTAVRAEEYLRRLARAVVGAEGEKTKII